MVAGLGRYKISTRLGVGFGLIIAFLAVLTATGIWSLSTISGKLEQIINVNNTKSDLSRTIQNSIASTNKSILATILANDSEVTQAESKKIGEARAAYQAALEKLEKLETSAKGKELIKNINDNLVQVKASNDETLEVMRAGMVREAGTMVTGNMQTSGMLADACREMVEFQTAQTAIRAKESRTTYFKALLSLLIIGAVVFAFAIFLASFLARSISKPMSDGVTVAHRIADGDLTTYIDTNATDETGQLLGAMKEMVTKLQHIIAQVKSAAEKISSSSYNLNSSSETMSVGASEQAARAAQVATASEEMSQTILDIAKNTSSIENSATATAKIAKDGEEVMGRSVDKVKAIATTIDQSAQLTRSLGERSNQIGDIISVINDIADQTNLLALNAAIEAARAGDAGRGFAVVADEVKKLAERTGNSTSEIGGMIKAIQDEVRLAVVSMENIAEEVAAGVDLSSQAGEVLRSIVGSINELHAMVQQIASATEQMASTSDGINRDIESIASVSKGTLGDSEQVAKASHKLADLSIYLEKVVGGFKV